MMRELANDKKLTVRLRYRGFAILHTTFQPLHNETVVSWLPIMAPFK